MNKMKHLFTYIIFPIIVVLNINVSLFGCLITAETASYYNDNVWIFIFWSVFLQINLWVLLPLALKYRLQEKPNNKEN